MSSISSWRVALTVMPVMGSSAPELVALADALDGPMRAVSSRNSSGTAAGGFLLASGEEELLDARGRVGVAATDHVVVMEVLGAVAHAADVEGGAGLHGVEGAPGRRR